MKKDIRKIIKESIFTKENIIKDSAIVFSIERAIDLIVCALKNRKKIFIFGNGGSAGDAQHFAGEMVNRFKIDRKPLPVIALTTDTSIITAIANDSGYDYVFSKQIEALGATGDIAIAITTSDIEEKSGGHSSNIANALISARNQGLKTVGLISGKSKEILRLLDIGVRIPSLNTPRVQESHIMVIHVICEITEKLLFGNKKQ